MVIATAGAPAQDAGSAYGDSVRAYRAADVGVVGSLLAMPRTVVDHAVGVALSRATPWSWPELRAAALLHSDAAVQLLGAGDVEGAGFHLQTAQRLLRRVVDLSAAQEDFEWRWYVTVTAIAHRAGAPALSRPLEDLAAKKWPARSPRSLYLRAVDLEVQAARLHVRSGPSATRGDVYTKWFVGAAAALEEALDRQPTFGAAALHLARMQMLEGSRDRAAGLFRSALADVDPTVRYLASLFLGSLEERGGRMAEAEALYRAAARHWPYGQSAALALAELLGRVGREEEARDTLVDRLLTPTARRGLEPLWVYAADRAEELGTRLGLLRAETWQ